MATSNPFIDDTDSDEFLTIPFTQLQPPNPKPHLQHIDFVTATAEPPANALPVSKKACFTDFYITAQFPSGIPRASHGHCPQCRTAITQATDAEHKLSRAHIDGLPRPQISAIDRSRMGLRYLAKYGWDVDKRTGLGRDEQGIAEPLKYKRYEDRLGIGAKKRDVRKKAQVKTFGARRIREMYAKEKREKTRLWEMFK